MVLQEFGLPTCLGKSPHHSPPPSPLGGLPPEEKQGSLRSFLWTLAYRVVKKLPGGVGQKKVFSFLQRLTEKVVSRAQGAGETSSFMGDWRNFLARLIDLDFWLLWLERYYPDLFGKAKVTVELAA